MRCFTCGTEITSGRKFCPECGSPLSRLCAKCGAQNSSTAKFCEDCSASLETPEVGSTKTANDVPIRITEPPKPENLKGERKTVTALFADIKGSIELMEDLDPEVAAQRLGAPRSSSRTKSRTAARISWGTGRPGPPA